MIDVRELRVGNWVTDNFDKANPFVPTKISLDDFVAMSQGCNNYHPIPLTEEILLKCGFVKDEDFNESTDYDWVYIDKSRHGIVACNDGKYISLYPMSLCGESKSVSSLHQLQNLYFALTGQELNIEL